MSTNGLRQWVTVVQVKAGTNLTASPSGEVIVLAVTADGRERVEWRTTERPQIGDRFSCEIAPVPLHGVAS